MKFKKIVLGISGGVDSAVSAFLLKRLNFNVEAVYMRNWDLPDELGECQADKDAEHASTVCKILGIPFREISFAREYWVFVFNEFLNDYQKGLTPNPDVLCNRYIKFQYFYNYAKNTLGADALATGHYARSSFGSFLEKYDDKTKMKLLRPKDDLKDQTLFLSQVNQEMLRNTMFPVGNLLKSEVRQIAREQNLTVVSNKRDSTGICFIGKRKFNEFISEYIDDKPGKFIDIDTGQVVGEHLGVHFYTIGQRSKIGGRPTAFYIARKCVENNNIFVASGVNHSFLFSKVVYLQKPHWISGEEPASLANGMTLNCLFRFQHTKPLKDCVLFKLNDNEYLGYLRQPLRAITPGQYGVFYVGDECLGSARILAPGPSMYHLNSGRTKVKQADILTEYAECDSQLEKHRAKS